MTTSDLHIFDYDSSLIPKITWIPPKWHDFIDFFFQKCGRTCAGATGPKNPARTHFARTISQRLRTCSHPRLRTHTCDRTHARTHSKALAKIFENEIFVEKLVSVRVWLLIDWRRGTKMFQDVSKISTYGILFSKDYNRNLFLLGIH